MPLLTRRNAARAALAALLLSAVPYPRPAMLSDPAAPDHAQLACFANMLLPRTPARAAVVFVLPEDENDGGLINHRLRYILPGRYIRTNRDSGTAPELHTPDYVATWTPGTCSGRLERIRR
jgi:hypothetical protein